MVAFIFYSGTTMFRGLNSGAHFKHEPTKFIEIAPFVQYVW